MAGYPIVTGISNEFVHLFLKLTRYDSFFGFNPDNVTIGSGGLEIVYSSPGETFRLTFFASALSEFEHIGIAFAYEQKAKTRLARQAFFAAVPKTQLEDVVRRG